MNDRIQMGIVEIEQIGRDRVTNAAPIASSRSGRPMIPDVAAPLKGSSVRSAALTAGSCAEPSAVAKKFRIERFAS
jgi:hypothetical protein